MAEIETLVETQRVFNEAHFLIKYKSTGEVKAKAQEMIAARFWAELFGDSRPLFLHGMFLPPSP
jgi:hypothetical protein